MPQLLTGLLLGLTCYFALATTVHPWYIATPLLLSVFTRYRYVIVWSFVVMLSYVAYQQTAVVENLYLVGLEYILVTAYLIYELSGKNQITFKRSL